MQPNAVGADAEEGRMPEGWVGGEATDQVPRACHHGEHEREDEHVENPVLQADDRSADQHEEEHQAPGQAGYRHIAPLPTVPNRPCGRINSTRMRMTKNVISDHAGEMVDATT